MSTPILITIPSYVNTSRNSSLVGYKTTSNNENSITRGKKRRLDHLTWEEKVLRKKLKNRVAAQTSRDRKKAKMDEMENSLNILVKQNETLIKECQSLRELNEKLLKENAELREKMTSTSSCRHQVCSVGCGLVKSGPAVSVDSPLQQGRAAQPAAHLLLQILMACLLLPTSADSIQSSMPINLKNLPKAYSKISLENLKQVVREKISRGELQIPANSLKLQDWWGRHQNAWNPVGTTKA